MLVRKYIGWLHYVICGEAARTVFFQQSSLFLGYLATLWLCCFPPIRLADSRYEQRLWTRAALKASPVDHLQSFPGLQWIEWRTWKCLNIRQKVAPVSADHQYMPMLAYAL